MSNARYLARKARADKKKEVLAEVARLEKVVVEACSKILGKRALLPSDQIIATLPSSGHHVKAHLELQQHSHGPVARLLIMNHSRGNELGWSEEEVNTVYNCLDQVRELCEGFCVGRDCGDEFRKIEARFE